MTGSNFDTVYKKQFRMRWWNPHCFQKPTVAVLFRSGIRKQSAPTVQAIWTFYYVYTYTGRSLLNVKRVNHNIAYNRSSAIQTSKMHKLRPTNKISNLSLVILQNCGLVNNRAAVYRSNPWLFGSCLEFFLSWHSQVIWTQEAYFTAGFQTRNIFPEEREAKTYFTTLNFSLKFWSYMAHNPKRDFR